jgi:hypothetical protein
MDNTFKHEAMISYGDPLVAGIRRRRKGYPIMSYNDRSPEIMAMNAHLRASVYPEHEGRVSTMTRLKKENSRPQRMSWFGNLRRRSEARARSSFLIETILFIVAVTLTLLLVFST